MVNETLTAPAEAADMAARPGAKALREALLPFIAPSALTAWALFLGTAAIYAGAICLAGFTAAPLWLRVLASLIAGGTIPSLFVIGHDAAHGGYTVTARGNAVIARLCFLPSLHNYSLWAAVHNRQHHRLPNLKGANSWSPLSPNEYARLSRWGKRRERLYRSPLGFAPYYLVERWWRAKFFPREALPGVDRAAAWRDLALLCGCLAALVAALAWQGGIVSVLLGFVVPFLVWNMMMGATTYLQHTGRRVPWFATEAEWRRRASDELVTVHLAMPRWYGFISHHIMEHPAHHFQPRIPLYRLGAAQARLNELLGDRAQYRRFTPSYLFLTVRACKLYDYVAHRWVDFAGNPTSGDLLAAVPASASLPAETKAA
jgi:omega-6 fatty acid desaturase (delta-12 desaturase)